MILSTMYPTGPFHAKLSTVIVGHWSDSIGNSVQVSQSKADMQFQAVLTPIVDHPDARDRVVIVRYGGVPKVWRCGKATLEYVGDDQRRLVWVTDDGRRTVWSRIGDSGSPLDPRNGSVVFPWLLNNAEPEFWLPLETPRDILADGARITAVLDIRQIIGSKSEPQERLTHILMDHDLYSAGSDYLIPGADSPLWQTLDVPPSARATIIQRIQRIPHELLCNRVFWGREAEVWVGPHKISCRARDIEILESRWVLPSKDKRKALEIARLLALYSVFDIPLSNRRNGVHLGLDPEIRRACDYELFASPLNAAVANGHFASKWPHIEWRFGSIGKYPTVLSCLPVNSVVCVNPPFTDSYLADVMSRLGELKLRFRLRIAVPIQEVPWRRKLHDNLPSAQLLQTYYDASTDSSTDVLHPTLLWEDPRCPARTSLPGAPAPRDLNGYLHADDGSILNYYKANNNQDINGCNGCNGCHGGNGCNGCGGCGVNGNGCNGCGGCGVNGNGCNGCGGCGVNGNGCNGCGGCGVCGGCGDFGACGGCGCQIVMLAMPSPQATLQVAAQAFRAGGSLTGTDLSAAIGSTYAADTRGGGVCSSPESGGIYPGPKAFAFNGQGATGPPGGVCPSPESGGNYPGPNAFAFNGQGATGPPDFLRNGSPHGLEQRSLDAPPAIGVMPVRPIHYRTGVGHMSGCMAECSPSNGKAAEVGRATPKVQHVPRFDSHDATSRAPTSRSSPASPQRPVAEETIRREDVHVVLAPESQNQVLSEPCDVAPRRAVVEVKKSQVGLDREEWPSLSSATRSTKRR